ncbi:FxLD family lantipeptide [Amycolatopsis rhizosphaerae]|uniref:FxLD family lantipeptide n=1 Tax=Amycolatopsis rhizosphaerae TaxID=2053003 RepID=A0A558DLS9_9PSEU|nr:FxLD family lanthipeptide [Amycolatopsis rhizosphaerae]TVT61976.1 FxLD family lantipeptide [Amycolatopsis rhizosphaerae]
MSIASTVPRSGSIDDREFSLDFSVIEAAYPLAKLSCDTSDGCGQTCSTSACNSQANNPS